jgi:subtilisin family serine protease
LAPVDVPCPGLPSITAAPAVATEGVLALTDPGAQVAGELASRFGARTFAGVPTIGLHAWSVPAARVDAFVTALRMQPGVRHVQLDQPVGAARTPHDPLLGWQWALKQVHAPRAWDVDVGVTNQVAVAVLDTGVDGTHPDLLGRVGQGIDTVDGDTDAADEHFHGTAVSSIIAADTDNRIGIAGLSWGAQIVPVRVLGANGMGSECTIAAGIVWAATHARILNMSLGAATPCTLVTQQAVDYATRQGALLIAAAGNPAKHGNPVQEPADCNGVVGVGATDQRDRAASFSEHRPYVDLSAPGVGVLAAYRDPHGRHGWASLDGTSMAAPVVAGIAALLLSRHPGWTAAQIEQRLESTAVDLGKRGRDDYFGLGRVDAARALGH